MKILLRDWRLAFPNIWKASAPKRWRRRGVQRFVLLAAPDHKQIPEIKKAMAAVAAEKWGAKSVAVCKALESADKLALHNGDAKSEYEGFEGQLFISTRSKIRPSAVRWVRA